MRSLHDDGRVTVGPVPERPVLADKIVVTQNLTKRIFTLEINGQRFPWAISSDGIRTVATSDDMPMITISIPANKVVFLNEVDSPA